MNACLASVGSRNSTMAVMPPSGSSTRPRLPCLPKTSSSSATLVLAGRFFTRITVLLRSPAACHVQWGKKGEMGFKKAKPSILLTEDFRSNTPGSLNPRHSLPGFKGANSHLANTSIRSTPQYNLPVPQMLMYGGFSSRSTLVWTKDSFSAYSKLTVIL